MFSFYRSYNLILSIIDIGGGLLDYRRRNDMAALAPVLPPVGTTTGKSIMPRARRNLPVGIRNRFGKEEV